MEKLKQNSQLYIRRFKKEKRFRRRLQEELEIEKKRRMHVEEALRMTSAETLKRITESLTRDHRVLSTEATGELPGGPSSLDGHAPNSNDKMNSVQLSPSNGEKARRESGDDHRSSPASNCTNASNVAIAAAAAAAAAAAQFNAAVSTSEASSDRGTPPRGNFL